MLPTNVVETEQSNKEMFQTACTQITLVQEVRHGMFNCIGFFSSPLKQLVLQECFLCYIIPLLSSNATEASLSFQVLWSYLCVWRIQWSRMNEWSGLKHSVTVTPTYVNCQIQCWPKIRRMPISSLHRDWNGLHTHIVQPNINLEEMPVRRTPTLV